MEQETKLMDPKTFIDNVDSWIKQIRAEFSQITDVSSVVEENVCNIQHNYELIYELKEQVETLKDEIKALKVMQLINLKESLARKH
ncbi:MAG: hypothetical protein KKC75_05670 [Nanoarchaeota archaeon]|nr:hypothetical protein [Nanoarchaeota archaeon]MBU1004936.1 hypothetical protein [Nanoarchaeota archaeon]MBU1945618.1 hypothetical protein [Nanoarchaeota archaeon]